jgi:hypothetical protein
VVRLTEAPAPEPWSTPATPRILDVGRKTRTIPPALRRALEARDRGCRFPGCGLRFTDAHHIRHWADGGETRLGNLVLLCRFHHRLVHEEGFRVHAPTGGAGSKSGDRKLYFLDRRMRLIPDAPPPTPPLPPRPVQALVERNRLRGVQPDYSTGSARYRREVDVPPEVVQRALEAVEDLHAVGP